MAVVLVIHAGAERRAALESGDHGGSELEAKEVHG